MQLNFASILNKFCIAKPSSCFTKMIANIIWNTSFRFTLDLMWWYQLIQAWDPRSDELAQLKAKFHQLSQSSEFSATLGGNILDLGTNRQQWHNTRIPNTKIQFENKNVTLRCMGLFSHFEMIRREFNGLQWQLISSLSSVYKAELKVEKGSSCMTVVSNFSTL